MFATLFNWAIRPILLAVIGQAGIQAIHLFGYHPDRWIAERVVTAPVDEWLSLVQWGLAATFAAVAIGLWEVYRLQRHSRTASGSDPRQRPARLMQWDRVDDFAAWHVAWLWSDLEPVGTNMDGTLAYPNWQRLRQDLNAGRLGDIPRDNNGSYLQSRIPKANLLQYSIDIGERPKFLFKSERYPWPISMLGRRWIDGEALAILNSSETQTLPWPETGRTDPSSVPRRAENKHNGALADTTPGDGRAILEWAPLAGTRARETKSCRRYGEPLLCQVFRVGLTNRSKSPIHNASIVVERLTLPENGQELSLFLGERLWHANRDDTSVAISSGATEWFDVIFTTAPNINHTGFEHRIRLDEFGFCLPDKFPENLSAKRNYILSLRSQSDETTMQIKRFRILHITGGVIEFQEETDDGK